MTRHLDCDRCSATTESVAYSTGWDAKFTEEDWDLWIDMRDVLTNDKALSIIREFRLSVEDRVRREARREAQDEDEGAGQEGRATPVDAVEGAGADEGAALHEGAATPSGDAPERADGSGSSVVLGGVAVPEVAPAGDQAGAGTAGDGTGDGRGAEEPRQTVCWCPRCGGSATVKYFTYGARISCRGCGLVRRVPR